MVCSASVSIPRVRARTLAYARLLICGDVLDRDQPCANSGPCPSVRVPSLQSRRQRERERHMADSLWRRDSAVHDSHFGDAVVGGWRVISQIPSFLARWQVELRNFTGRWLLTRSRAQTGQRLNKTWSTSWRSSSCECLCRACVCLCTTLHVFVQGCICESGHAREGVTGEPRVALGYQRASRSRGSIVHTSTVFECGVSGRWAVTFISGLYS